MFSYSFEQLTFKYFSMIFYDFFFISSVIKLRQILVTETEIYFKFHNADCSLDPTDPVFRTFKSY